MANKNFSKVLKSFAEESVDEEKEYKVTLELPSDKVADAGIDIMSELKDSGITIMNQDLIDNKMILTLKGKIDKKALRTMLREACYANELKMKDFTLKIG